MKKFHSELGEPIAIALQPSNEEKKWGRWQFPGLQRTADGHILASFEYGSDSYQYEASIHYRVSEDGGKTWREKRENERPAYTKMPNGKYFVGLSEKAVIQRIIWMPIRPYMNMETENGILPMISGRTLTKRFTRRNTILKPIR